MTGFTEWFTEAAADGKLYGQSPRTIAEMAFEAGYAARETAELPSEVPWDELTAIFPPDYSRRGKSDAIKEEIKRKFAPPQPFSGRSDADYELPALGSLGQEAYDRHFGAPGPVPAIPGLNGEPGEDEPYDDEEF